MRKYTTLRFEYKKVSMEEIGNSIRLSEKYTTMTSPIFNRLGYNGMPDWGRDILKGADILV